MNRTATVTSQKSFPVNFSNLTYVLDNIAANIKTLIKCDLIIFNKFWRKNIKYFFLKEMKQIKLSNLYWNIFRQIVMNIGW